MKRTIPIIATFLATSICFSQTLFKENFSSLSLVTTTNSINNSLFSYANTLGSMIALNNNSAIADTLSGNYPFRVAGQKQQGFITYKPSNITDTFAVSTSWLLPQGSADAWLISPLINNITSNSVLVWESMAPDANNKDGYDVYVSTSSNANPLASDFTTNIYTITNESATWQKRGVSLAEFAGQTIRIAFRNTSSNKYQLWIDDIEVKNTSHTYDANAMSFDTYKYSTPNSNNIISASIKNTGSMGITNLSISYKIGNNAIVNETKLFSSPINYMETRELSFSDPFISTQAGYYPVKIWVNEINGHADELATNDTVYGSITLVSSLVNKSVLLETYTSTRYGWAPDAESIINTALTSNTNIVVANIHENDSMGSSSASVLANNYGSDEPSATIDHYYFAGDDKLSLNRFDWNTFITKRKTDLVPAAVSIASSSYNPITREITATVSAQFVGDVIGDYRIGLYIKENHVYGSANDISDNGWNQYSFLHNVSSSPYYQKGTNLNSSTYLLSSNDYKHQHVIHEVVGGAYGQGGIIPNSGLTSGQTFTATYTYTLPTATGNNYIYNTDNIYLVGVVSEYDIDATKRAVLNVVEKKLTTSPEYPVGVNEIDTEWLSVNVFPNPTNDICYLKYSTSKTQLTTITVYNSIGEPVHILKHISVIGENYQQLDVSKFTQGIYSIVIEQDQKSTTKKLLIIK